MTENRLNEEVEYLSQEAQKLAQEMHRFIDVRSLVWRNDRWECAYSKGASECTPDEKSKVAAHANVRHGKSCPAAYFLNEEARKVLKV